MKRILLTRLHDRFRNLVLEYMRTHDMKQGQLARLVDMKRTNLNALLGGNRHLSAYYVFKFIMKGVIVTEDIYDGHPENEREADFWKTATEATNVSLLQAIARIRQRGDVDIDSLILSLDKKSS